MTLGTFPSKRLHKSYEKIEMVLWHVLKRISHHGCGLDMIFIQLVVCFYPLTKARG